MDRRDILRGLLALPITSALGASQHQPKERHPRHPTKSGKLSVVIDGAFAIVVQKDRRSRVRVFTPRDRQNRHQFYFFGDSEHDAKSPLRAHPGDQTYHFELSSEGLQMNKEPEVDSRQSAFNVSTSKWCQEDYFVTIDLPAPERITFTPPLRPVKFKNHEGTGCMPFNHVLEYDITDISAVKMALGERVFGPTRCADLIRRYEDECKKQDKNSGSYSDTSQHKSSGCPDLNEYASTCPESSFTFFFGVGMPPGPDDHERLEHAIHFFNERILESFPDLKKRLEIATLGRKGEPCKSEPYSSNAALAPAVMKQEMSQEPRLLEVSYIVDCDVTGPVVSFPK